MELDPLKDSERGRREAKWATALLTSPRRPPYGWQSV